MQGIEIPIGAPLGQLDKDLKGAESKLKGFAAEASKSAAAPCCRRGHRGSQRAAAGECHPRNGPRI